MMFSPPRNPASERQMGRHTDAHRRFEEQQARGKVGILTHHHIQQLSVPPYLSWGHPDHRSPYGGYITESKTSITNTTQPPRVDPPLSCSLPLIPHPSRYPTQPNPTQRCCCCCTFLHLQSASHHPPSRVPRKGAGLPHCWVWVYQSPNKHHHHHHHQLVRSSSSSSTMPIGITRNQAARAPPLLCAGPSWLVRSPIPSGTRENNASPHRIASQTRAGVGCLFVWMEQKSRRDAGVMLHAIRKMRLFPAHSRISTSHI
ncbi:hypothetical protein QBC39DRAFT_183815 [Podospora conica]|nr:hypothetical protein QBC39DRAFT_183815 [Schizothecium conicum]